MLQESMCDVCRSPGACCSRMVLSSNPDGVFPFQAPMSHERAEHRALEFGLPMVPTHQREDGVWYYGCTALGPDGRCAIYENRPQLCRDFKPGSDPLCVHFWPEEEDV